ncbi:hypothetical protein G7A72_10615 [Flavobacterium sp. Sr18]|jgi:hypothetical protein|uniref:DUF6624 domain-containing protein n=1 Tax=Flavobacterium sp. Sr18 TaxID=935222 RepID=UPI0013E43948|nr:DUF6624 domain-containing protein [Flavobacterium sp. Sr18]QIH39233.1 hypothetical protein G7A72_10615 [Flavobacterium sp. Sr18]
MKKIIIIFTFLILSCSTTKLSKTESENLKTEFTEMYKIDQIAQAGKPNGEFKNYPLENWYKFKDSVFTKNKNRVEYLFKKYGYLGINEIGKNASNDFWILVQHSDKFPEFQKNVLKSMKKELKKGNANPDNYALLLDRVNVNSGEKQNFGTQVNYRLNGQAKPKIGLIDSLNIDKRRIEYGLKPLKDYLNQMTEMHFEMNKEYFAKKGIVKPNLYN